MTAATGPLTGVRVVDLTQYVLGPFATQTLGDLGCDVIKVEEPTGDRQRRAGHPPNDPAMGPVFVGLNRNKRSIALDLKTDPGRRALRKLIATADIFIHNMRPEAVQRLGFGYGAVAAIKPDIVYVEAMGYDPAGPYAGRQAFDDMIQAASGACGLDQLVDPEADLRFVPSIIADKTSGLYAAIAAISALRHRDQTGEGQYVSVPMLEVFTGFILAEHLYDQVYIPPRGKYGQATTVTPNRKPYQTKDGWLALLPNKRSQSAKFMELGGVAGGYESERFLTAEGRGRMTVYYEMMREAALAHTTEAWLALCEEHSIPAMRVNRIDQVYEDPQLSQTLFTVRDLEGEGPYHAMKPGLRFAKTPVGIHKDPPPVGRHTAEVLAELGMSADEIS